MLVPPPPTIMELIVGKIIASGISTISILGSGVGIGTVFASLISAYSRTPLHNKRLFVYALLGFALCEAIALFGLMMSFLLLYSQ
jgi:F-type H+-transporting ATPase subunit c